MNLLETRTGRRVLFALLYLCEGAPIGFLWWALPSVLRSRGVEADRIGALLAWLVLPWAFKWVWAPLIDRWSGARFGLRGWIVASQAAMALSLVPLLLVDPLAHFEVLVGALIVHAVCASTQDAAIDALMIRSTGEHERGSLSGWMQVGMLTGRSLLGGGALLLVDSVGERALTGLLLAVLVGGLGLAALYREAQGDPAVRSSTPGASLGEGLGRRLVRALESRRTWVGLAFAATAGAGFEALGAFAGPMLTDLAAGATDAAGRFFLIHAVVAAALGGLVGGSVADRVGPRRSTALFGLAIAGAVISTALMSGSVAAAEELVPWLTLTYAAIGGFTASSYALFMELTDRHLAATQFSAYMGATNLCESWAVASAGALIPAHGYGPSLAGIAVVGLAALLLLPLTRRSDAGASIPWPPPDDARG